MSNDSEYYNVRIFEQIKESLAVKITQKAIQAIIKDALDVCVIPNADAYTEEQINSLREPCLLHFEKQNRLLLQLRSNAIYLQIDLEYLIVNLFTEVIEDTALLKSQSEEENLNPDLAAEEIMNFISKFFRVILIDFLTNLSTDFFEFLEKSFDESLIKTTLHPSMTKEFKELDLQFNFDSKNVTKLLLKEINQSEKHRLKHRFNDLEARVIRQQLYNGLNDLIADGHKPESITKTMLANYVYWTYAKPLNELKKQIDRSGLESFEQLIIFFKVSRKAGRC